MKTLRETAIGIDDDIVIVRQQAKRIAELLSLPSQAQTRLATAVSEVARDVLSCGCKGRAEFVLDTRTSPPLLLVRIHAVAVSAPERAESAGSKRLPAVGSEAMIAARRLVEHFDYIACNNTSVLIELGKHTPARARMQSRLDIERAMEDFSDGPPLAPSAVLSDQNRELIFSLQEVQDKQEELQRLNHELQDTNRGVVALYAELEERAEQLRAASDAKSRFFANVSHEFRTPLNSILALSRLLLDRVDGGLQPEQEKQIVFIRRSAETLLEFVNDLLDLAKAEAGKIDVNLGVFSIADLLRGLRGVLKPLQTSDAVELIFEDCEAVRIVSDEGKIAQVLRNLVSNALKYTERGEVRVSADIDRAKGNVTFVVRDTGIGIAPADQPRIFEEFEQVAGSFQQKNKGSGLGLALSRRLARLLRGEITVQSALGAGSTFRFCVPLDHRYPLGTALPAIQSRDEKRVLVVDDEETFRYVVRHIVESEPGYELIEAQDGGEGLLRARRDRPDVLILDLQMPVMSGREVLRELSADPATRDIPVIVSTSLPITATLQKELLGAFRLVSKSNLSKDVLLDALQRSLAAERTSMHSHDLDQQQNR